MIKRLTKTNISLLVIALCAMLFCGLFAINSLTSKEVPTAHAEGNEARIGTEEYATLEEAFASATADCTIYTLVSEISVESKITVKHNIALACDVTNTIITRDFDDVLFNLSYGKTFTLGLTTSDQYQLTINGNNKAYRLLSSEYGTVIINCGTYTGNGEAQATVSGEFIRCGTLNINGGTIKNFYSSGDGGAIYQNRGVVTIAGGTIANNIANAGSGIYMNSGAYALNISGGTISDDICVKGSKINISGGTIGDINSIVNSSYKSTININGNFIHTGNINLDEECTQKINIDVELENAVHVTSLTGNDYVQHFLANPLATYSSDIIADPSDFVFNLGALVTGDKHGDGFDTQSLYLHVNDVIYEAKINETNYYSLEQAFASVDEDDVIIEILVDEISIISVLNVNYNITLVCDVNSIITRNLNGYVFNIASEKTLTIGATTNDQYQLTINGNNKENSMFYVKGNLIINCGTFTGNGDEQASTGPQQGGCINAYQGSVIMNGGTIKNFCTIRYGGSAIYSTYASVTITGTSKLTNNTHIGDAGYGGGAIWMGASAQSLSISGDVEISNNSSVGRGGAIASISSATISGNVKIINNTATAAAGGIYSMGNLIISDNATITDNTRDAVDVYIDYSSNATDVISTINGGNIGHLLLKKTSDISGAIINKIEITFDSYYKVITTLNLNGDFILTDAIYLSGVEYELINVNANLNNTYKIAGNSEAFETYYKDTGKAIATYAEGITVDRKDFICESGSVITGSMLTDGNELSLYLTDEVIEDTPSTGFVDEQLLPALAIGLVSIIAVLYVVFTNKRKHLKI